MLHEVLSPSEPDIVAETAASPRGRWQVLGLPVDRVDMDMAVATIIAMIERARREPVPVQQIVTLNPEIAMAAQRDDQLRRIIRDAALVVPDGAGIVAASRLLRGGVVARVPGVELVERLAIMSAERGYRLFLLGAAPGVALEAARRLQTLAPGLAVVGAHSGSSRAEDAEAILAAIQRVRPDVLCVAFGSPKQERWLSEHRPQVGAAVAIGIGGALDYIAGAVKRAPRWMRALGLEWLFRLMRQPWRWRRMLALPRFVVAIIQIWTQQTRRTERRGGASRGDR